jgi:outer membrane biosynthesis protein TonB
MTEGVFILTALFVAYVIYVIVNEKKAGGDKITKPSVAASQPAQQASVSEKPKAEVSKPKPVAVAKKAPAAKPVETQETVAVEKTVETKKVVAVKKAAVAPAPKPAAPAPTSAPEATAIKGTGLKDPKTGEVATSYSNYRFTKRWIKEALVAEKLVDKVYKNDELNASVEAKIKVGIIKLEGMKKYKA